MKFGAIKIAFDARIIVTNAFRQINVCSVKKDSQN